MHLRLKFCEFEQSFVAQHNLFMTDLPVCQSELMGLTKSQHSVISSYFSGLFIYS